MAAAVEQEEKVAACFDSDVEEQFVKEIAADPSRLFIDDTSSKDLLRKMIHKSFATQSRNQNGNASKKIVFSNFGLDQVWQQISHHAEGLNRRALQRLEKLMEIGDDEDDEESPAGKQKQAGLIEMLREQEELVSKPMEEHEAPDQEDSQQDQEQESDK